MAGSRAAKPASGAALPRGVKLPRGFYAGETLAVARGLIGMHLVHAIGGGGGPGGDRGRAERRVGRIVETEAYKGPKDLASHSSRGRTERTAVMFGAPGHAYIYLIYGFWWCLNVVTQPEGIPHAVLIRALEPVEGVTDKTWGPGLLCRAMAIDRRLNGADLCGRELWIERPAARSVAQTQRLPRITRAPRIGVDYAGDWAAKPWRFFDRDSPFVSTVSASARARAAIAAAKRVA